MKAPVCSINTPIATEQRTPPTGSKKAQSTEEYFDQVAKEGGVLNNAQQLEIGLQKDFITGVSNMLSTVPVLGNYNRVESALATLLGWKRWLWQSVSQGTDAGLVREALFERSMQASEMVRMIAIQKSLPDIQRLYSTLVENATNVPATRLQELLHDQIIVGNAGKLLNVVDSPLVMERLHQRYMKHQANLDDVGLSPAIKQQLEDLSVRISNTFDETRYAAGKSGFAIDSIENGGYFPIRVTEEFSKLLDKSGEQWLSGFKPLKEVMQRQRRTNMPVVVNLDHITTLLQRQLLNKDVGEESLAALGEQELKVVGEQATKAQDTIAEIRVNQRAAQTKATEEATKSLAYKQKLALSRAKDLLETRNRVVLQKEAGELKLQSYKPAERKAILAEKKAELAARTESALADITTKWEERVNRKTQQLDTKFAKETDDLVESSLRSQSKEVQSVLDFEKAKLRLLEINANPGELSTFLSTHFSEGQLKRLFEGGFLTQMPAMSDELLEFYRGMDLGVRGLSDAIVMNPVEALKGYAEELSKAAGEQMMFKTAFDMGAQAGWVKAAVTPEEAANYIKVGSNPMLAKYLPNSGLTAEVSDMWIHKTAAGQLDALMKINTSPAELNSAAQGYQMFTSFMRKGLIIQGTTGYAKRVFVQNVISLYASTGSLAQFPFALVDVFRAMAGLPIGDDAAKVFKIGDTSYSVGELMREVALRRGGYTAEAMNDPRNILQQSFSGFSKEAQERANHFNSVYAMKYGEPLTGKVGQTRQTVGKVFNAAYGGMALVNSTLDNAARWAAVRELASTGKYDNLDTILRELDTYFSINADGGSIGKMLGNSYMPFAQFAINAPGAALRHAINHPWRTANVMQLYSQASQQSGLTEAELPPWMRESKDYFFSAYRDPNTGKHGVVMPQNVDFMLDSYTWMTSLARDLAGSPQSVTDYISQESNPAAKVQKAFADIVSKNYLANAGLALMGVDPKSLKPFDNSAPADTLLGVSTPIGIRTMITNLVPMIRQLDQSLPPQLVGRAPTKTELVGGVKTFADPGVPSIFGNTPTTGGSRQTKDMPALARLFEGLTGITVTEIDPQQNVISTYKDFNTKLKEIHTNRLELYRKLVLTNAAPTSAEYQRYDHLKQLEVVLSVNKSRIDLLAARKGLAPPILYEQLQGNFNEMLTMPIDNDVQMEMLQILQEEPNE